MWNLIFGLVLIAIFFLLVLMLKRGYVEKQKQEETKKEGK